MEPLKCTCCGALLIKDGTDMVCEYCGMRYQAGAVQKMLDSLAAGEAKILEKRMKNGVTFLRLNDYIKAAEVFDQMIEDYPEDYRGWWGMLLVETRSFQRLDADYKESNFHNAYQLAPKQKKHELERCYRDYLEHIDAYEQQLQEKEEEEKLRQQDQERETAQRVKLRWYISTVIAVVVFTIACSLCFTKENPNIILVPSIILDVYNFIAPMVVRQYSELAGKELRAVGVGYHVIPLIIHMIFMSSIPWFDPMASLGFSFGLVGISAFISLMGFISKQSN